MSKEKEGANMQAASEQGSRFSDASLRNSRILASIKLRDSQFEISNLKIRNIKSIDEASVDLSGVNLFLGSNSAGKSTLLQTLALLSQNSQNYGRGDLMLNGAAVRLGNFSEFYRRNSSSPAEIELELKSIEVEDTESKTKQSPDGYLIKAKFSLSPNSKNPGVSDILSASLTSERGDKHESIVWESLAGWEDSQWNFRAVQIIGSTDEAIGIFDERKSPLDLYPSYFLRKQLFGAWLATRLMPSAIDSGKKLRSTLDAKFQEEIAKVIYSELETFRKFAEDFGGDQGSRDVQLNFARHLRNFQPSIVLRQKMRAAEYSVDALVDGIDEAILKIGFPRIAMLLPDLKPQYRFEYEELGFCGQKVAEALRNKVHYLGPLRIEPTGIHRQDSAPLPVVPVGVRGEYSSYQLHYGPFSSRLMYYPLPLGQPSTKMTLLAAVECWFRWFQLGERVSIREEGQSGLVTKTDEESLYQKGTGVSQILPVIVLSLLSEPDSVVLIEQPELHLHPALQQKLGNFFVQLAKTDRKFIIETHSEYLVTRLRKLVSVSGENSASINIFFATKSSDATGSTSYLKSSIESTGDLSTWPEGFFDYAEDDNIEIMLNRIMADEGVE